MAWRLCLDERAGIKAMAHAGLSPEKIAGRLGWHCSTIRCELARVGGPQWYWVVDTQQSADPSVTQGPKLASDAELAEAVAEDPQRRRSPHAVSADLRGRSLRVCAETTYRACYDHIGKLNPSQNQNPTSPLRRAEPVFNRTTRPLRDLFELAKPLLRVGFLQKSLRHLI